MRDPILQTLATTCREHPTREKIMILQSLTQGHIIGERLAREGVPWINFRMETPFHLATEIAGPILARNKLTLVTDVVGPAIVRNLMEEMMHEGQAPYFGHLAEFTGLPPLLWKALKDLRMTMMTSQIISPKTFIDKSKGDEIRTLLERFEKFLTASHLIDEAGLMTIAIESNKSTSSTNRFLFIDASVAWSPVHQHFLDSLPGEKHFLTPEFPQGLLVPRRLEHSWKPVIRQANPTQTQPPSNIERLNSLFDPVHAPPPVQDESISMFHAGGHDAEVHEVLRRAFQHNTPLDAIEIAYTAEDPYVALVWSTCARLDIPLTIAGGLPASLTSPGRALSGFCQWVAGGLHALDLANLLRSGAVSLPQDLGSLKAARFIEKSISIRGRDAYAIMLPSLIAEEESHALESEKNGDTEMAERIRERSTHLGQLHQWVTQLISSLPVITPSNNLDGAQFYRACSSFLTSSATSKNPFDAEAVIQLVSALNELAEFEKNTTPLPITLHQIADLLNSIRVGRQPPRAGALHLTPVSSMGWSGRPLTFVVGIDQGALPGSSLEDPVLLDQERGQLHPWLATSSDRAAEALFLGASRFASLVGTLTASYTALDLREQREVYPGSLLLQLLRLQSPDHPDLSYEDLLKHLGEKRSRVPLSSQKTLEDQEWWLKTYQENNHHLKSTAYQVFPHLQQGETASMQRHTSPPPRYDGNVPTAALTLDPRITHKPVSASKLEELAECEYRYFLRNGLGLKPPEEHQDDGTLWLDARTKGQLLHEIFAKAVREHRDQHTPMTSEHLALLTNDILNTYAQLAPPPSPWIFVREQQALHRDVTIFADFQSGRSASLVVGIEVAFGIPETSGEPLTHPDPIPFPLPDHQEIFLRGRIDRIDRLGSEPRFEVMDYKTGSTWKFEQKNSSFESGNLFQYALYTFAGEYLLKKQFPQATVASFSYVFPTIKGGRAHLSPNPLPLTTLQTRIVELLESTKLGRFLMSPDKNTCDHCELRLACGSTPWIIGRLKTPEIASSTTLPPAATPKNPPLKKKASRKSV